jgi:hypothetical protein
MLHFAPEFEHENDPQPYAEAVARLAGIRHVLRLVDPSGGGPAGDFDENESLGMAWQEAGPAQKRRFDNRSGRVIASTAAGLDALLSEHQSGRAPHEAAMRRIAEQIRAGLDDLTRMLGGTETYPPSVFDDALPIAL